MTDAEAESFLAGRYVWIERGCLRACRNRVEDAKDMSQMTRIRFWSARERVNKDNAGSYLSTIIRNLEMDRFRKINGRMDENLEAFMDDNDPLLTIYDEYFLELPSHPKVLESTVSAIYKIFVEGYFTKEVAGMMGIPEMTLKARIWKARERFNDGNAVWNTSGRPQEVQVPQNKAAG